MSEQPVMAVGPHHCTGCGQIHGGEDQAAAVKIEEIRAKRDIEVARIGRGETREVSNTAAETEIAVAEIQAEAGIAETEALAAGIADAGGGADDAMPVITDVPVPDAEPEVQDSIAPRDETPDDIPPPAPKRSGLTYWP
jgi:hypothetical protein